MILEIISISTYGLQLILVSWALLVEAGFSYYYICCLGLIRLLQYLQRDNGFWFLSLVAVSSPVVWYLGFWGMSLMYAFWVPPWWWTEQLFTREAPYIRLGFWWLVVGILQRLAWGLLCTTTNSSIDT